MGIELKRVTENDLEKLMNWRMDEHISKMLFKDVKLTMEGQYKWFESLKKSETEIRWIVWKDGVPTGSMYLTDIDQKNKRCESGWFIYERNLFKFPDILELQYNVSDYVFDALKLNRIYGYVIDENIGIIKLSKLYGYELEGVMKKHVLKNNVFHDVFIMGLTKEMWEDKKKGKKYSKILIE